MRVFNMSIRTAIGICVTYIYISYDLWAEDVMWGQNVRLENRMENC